MSNNIFWTSGGTEGILGKTTIVLTPKTLDQSSTSLSLTGRGVFNYGEYQQENFIRLLENFASANVPSNPTVGQTWYHPAEHTLYLCVEAALLPSTTPSFFTSGGKTWIKVNSSSASDVSSALGYMPVQTVSVSPLDTSNVLTVTGTTNPQLSISKSTASSNGYLSAADWALFNAKQDKGGGTFSGPVYLFQDPLINAEAATKHYVDNHGVTSLTAGANISISGSTGSIVISATSAGTGSLLTLTEFNAGSICYFATNAAPTGYLIANGANVSRTTYPDLFAAIGTQHGAGDGSTTFTLPDLRGEFIRGWDGGRGLDTGRIFGSVQAGSNLSHTHTFTTNGQSNDHSHYINDPGHSHIYNMAVAGNSPKPLSNGTDPFGLYQQIATNTSTTGISVGGVTSNHTHSGGTNADGGAEARPRNFALLACIKAVNTITSPRGITVTDDTTSGATYYPALSLATSGILTALTTSSSELKYVANTGMLSSPALAANRVYIGNGSAGSPSLVFTSDGAQDTGLYWGGDGVIAIASNGVYAGQINAGGNLSMVGNISAGGTISAGAITGPTRAASDNTTNMATTAFVQAAVQTTVTIAAPKPTTVAGIGQFAFIGGQIPAGGTWAYYQMDIADDGNVVDARGGAGIAAGGTVLNYNGAGGGQGGHYGFAWRIA